MTFPTLSQMREHFPRPRSQDGFLRRNESILNRKCGIRTQTCPRILSGAASVSFSLRVSLFLSFLCWFPPAQNHHRLLSSAHDQAASISGYGI